MWRWFHSEYVLICHFKNAEQEIKHQTPPNPRHGDRAMLSGQQRRLKPFLGICVALRDNGVWDTVSKYIPVRKGGSRERAGSH